MAWTDYKRLIKIDIYEVHQCNSPKDRVIITGLSFRVQAEHGGDPTVHAKEFDTFELAAMYAQGLLAGALDAETMISWLDRVERGTK